MSGLSKSILAGILGILCVAEASAATYWCKKDADGDGVYTYQGNQAPVGQFPPYSCPAGIFLGGGWTYATTNPAQIVPADNCATVSNADQLNTDGDAQGNACDPDDDNDDFLDEFDLNPLDPLITQMYMSLDGYYKGSSIKETVLQQ